MRWIVLIACASCGVDPPPETPTSISVRTTFTGSTLGGSIMDVVRPGDVADDDLVLAAIQSPIDLGRLLGIPAGWSQLTDTDATGCMAQWHVFFAAGLAGTATTFSFRFDINQDYVGLFVAYTNAVSASVLRSQVVPEGTTDTVVPVAQGTPGSMLWIGGVANAGWPSDPPTLDRRGQNKNIVMYDRPITRREIAEVDVATSSGLCFGITEGTLHE